MQYLDTSSKMTELSQFISKSSLSTSQECKSMFLQSVQRSWSWSVLWRPRRRPRTNTKKRCSIHRWRLECESKNSRDTWSNSKFGLEGTSLIFQLVKNLPSKQENWVGKIPWRRERLPTPVFWPGEFHGLYRPWGHKESDTTEHLWLWPWKTKWSRVKANWILPRECTDYS